MNDILVLFSGGRDSMLTAARLLNRSSDNRVHLITYDNGCMYGKEHAAETASRLADRYGQNRVPYLGVYSVAGILYELLPVLYNLTGKELTQAAPGASISQLRCLVCRTAMYIHAIHTCIALKIPQIADGSKYYDPWVTAQPGPFREIFQKVMAQTKIAGRGIDLTFPIYNMPDDRSRNAELLRLGFLPSVTEPKCMIGTPANPLEDMTGAGLFFKNRLYPVIQKKNMLSPGYINPLICTVDTELFR